MTVALQDKILEFLRGTRLAERFPAELYIPTTSGDGTEWVLEDALLAALRDGRHIVIAGSAGGGKTTLINALIQRGTEQGGLQFTSPDDSGEGTQGVVVVIPDLTEIPEEHRDPLIRDASLGGPLVMAANEGAIHRANFVDTFGSVLQDLHSIQGGHTCSKADRPVVVDLAGLDPVRSRLRALLTTPDIHDAVYANEASPAPATSRSGCGDPEYCPRLAALKSLDGPVVDGLVDCLQLAVGPREITFRHVWEFVSDLFLGGSCDDGSSAWYWRAFYGPSWLSRLLRERFHPEAVAFPRLEDDLFHGAWNDVRSSLGEGLPFLTPETPPVRAPDPRYTMRWLKAQVLFLLAAREGLASLISRQETGVAAAIESSNPVPIAQAVNAYYRLRTPRASDREQLELWGDLGLARRVDRPSGLVRLAAIPQQWLGVRRSRIVANLDSVPLSGSRVFLVAQPPGASSESALQMDSRLIEALGRGRATRTSDRSNDDVEWALWTFATRLIDQMDAEHMGDLATLNFDRGFMRPQSSVWRIGFDGSLIRTGEG